MLSLLDSLLAACRPAEANTGLWGLNRWVKTLKDKLLESERRLVAFEVDSKSCTGPEEKKR